MVLVQCPVSHPAEPGLAAPCEFVGATDIFVDIVNRRVRILECRHNFFEFRDCRIIIESFFIFHTFRYITYYRSSYYSHIAQALSASSYRRSKPYLASSAPYSRIRKFLTTASTSPSAKSTRSKSPSFSDDAFLTTTPSPPVTST